MELHGVCMATGRGLFMSGWDCVVLILTTTEMGPRVRATEEALFLTCWDKPDPEKYFKQPSRVIEDTALFPVITETRASHLPRRGPAPSPLCSPQTTDTPTPREGQPAHLPGPPSRRGSLLRAVGCLRGSAFCDSTGRSFRTASCLPILHPHVGTCALVPFLPACLCRKSDVSGY